MDVQQDLAIRGESVERIYSYYLDEAFLVNRRYQRKLVWTVEEKQEFVDSISQGFPIPLILVASVPYKDRDRFEIIDGMQRLNAIVSFIEGEFDLNGKYFDLDTMAQSKFLKDQKKLHQKQPILERTICTKIAGYIFPLSIYQVGEERRIDQIFRRINSNGRHLSRQELRHAGVIGDFPEVVRGIASKIRGDVSHSDRLFLNSMKTISLTNKKLSYGINTDRIFWTFQQIITYKNIRESRDEELIAHLLAYMLLDKDPAPAPTAKVLDTFYGLENSQEEEDFYPDRYTFDEIENALNKITSEVIEKQFLYVYDEIKKILEASKYTFAKLIFERKWNYNHRHFHVIFLALYELLVMQSRKIKDYSAIAKKLEGIADKVMNIKRNDTPWNAQTRQININSVIIHIQDCFLKSSNNDPALDSWVSKLETLLTQSYTEQSQYDFKIGFHDLSELGEFNDSLLHKICETLTAMANNEPNNIGYIIIGIADKDSDAERHQKLYKTRFRQHGSFCITGIQDEIQKYYRGSEDTYLRKLKQLIEKEPITPEEAKRQILKNIRTVKYYDKSVLVLKIESGQQPYLYNGKIYERHGSNNSEVSPDQHFSIYQKFLSSK